MKRVIGKKLQLQLIMKKKEKINCVDLMVYAYLSVGVSLSTVGKSIVQINPDIPEANNLRSW